MLLKRGAIVALEKCEADVSLSQHKIFMGCEIKTHQLLVKLLLH